MNKALESDDDYNIAKRKSRTKVQLAVVRPWQNTVMVQFLERLFREAGAFIL